MKRFLLLSVIAFSYCFCPLAKAQSLDGVQFPEVWFGTFPVSSNLQGYYFWKDLSGDSVKTFFMTAAVQAMAPSSASCVRSQPFNFHPAFIYSVMSLSECNFTKEALLRFSNL